MFYKLVKKIFEYFINFLKFIQVLLIFISFFTIFYWLLQLGKVEFIKTFAPFFETIKNITHLFYNRTVTVDQATIDFAFLIASLTMLLIVYGLKFLVEYVESAEEKLDAIYSKFKIKAEKIFNAGLEHQYLMQEIKNNKFLMVVKFSAINLAKDSFFTKDTQVGVEEKELKILNEFINNIDKKLKCKKTLLNNVVLLYFENFNTIDNVIVSIENILFDLKRLYRAEKWDINTLMSVDCYANDNEIKQKLQNLLKLIQLGLKDKVSCFATFKQRYSLIKNPKYNIEGYGVYKILENEDVYYLNSL